ncbi:MAG: PqqD family protein [Myxococcota bacterium]|nr:PqqD family protein [Myxococcota bacterium]
MPVSLDTVVAQAERTAARVIDGKAVVIVIDKQELHTLNPTGTFIWERAESARSVSELVDQVVREFEVDDETARRDVVTFVERLVGLGGLTVVEAK